MRRERGRQTLRTAARPEFDERLAFAVLRAMMDHFLRPDSADRL